MPGDIPHTDSVAGIGRTCQVLAGTRNRAVLPLLLAGLQSSRSDVRAAAIRAAIRRHDSATHTQLIRQFAALAEVDQVVLCGAHCAMPHHAAPALRNAVLNGDTTLCKNACRIISLSGDFELFPILVKAAENKLHRHRDKVATTIFELAARVVHDLAHGADNRSGHRDPSFARHQLLVSLEQSVLRFEHHHRKEILDAFLLLAPIDNATLLKILRDSHHPSHPALVAELTSTEDAGIIERLVEILRDTDAPAAALKIIARRSDQRFLNVLLNGLKHPAPLRVLHNMKRLNRVSWLEEQRGLLLDLDGRAQAIAVELAMASELDRNSVFDLLAFLLQNGLGEARRASCKALAKFESSQADELVANALGDPDAGVQAAAVRQLRARRLPDALQRLVALLDSRSPEVRDAARSSLAEFNFTRYRTMFDLLDEQSARTTGVLVHKVDPSAGHKLIEELASPSITSKLRGIEMAIAMEATNDVRQLLIELVGHENVAVRKEAVAALAHCRDEQAVAILEVAANDPIHSIAEAAQQCLAQLRLNGSSSPGAVLAEDTA